jgi:outer membrane protein TolC
MLVKKKITIALIAVMFLNLPAFAENPELQGKIKNTKKISLQFLINEALSSNPEIKATEAKLSAAEYKIPQAKALPDPQLSFGYQNNSFGRFDLGEAELAWFQITASQTFPFYGKRTLRAHIASHEAMILKSQLLNLEIKTASKVKELYYDLFLAYKSLDILDDRIDLFSKTESAAISRYSTGMGQQQDILLAQTEKYNILAQQEQLKQKIQSIEAELNALLGRETNCPVGIPYELATTAFPYTLEQIICLAYKNSPELMSKGQTISQQDMRIKLARKEYFPDFTLNGTVFPRGGAFPTMWAVWGNINVPVVQFKAKRSAVLEAEASANESLHSMEQAKLEISSGLRDNYSVITASDRLMRIYKNGLISRNTQNFELALTGYVTGKNDALITLTTLKNLIDYETSYWEQFVAREKAIAKIEAIAGVTIPPTGVY